MADFRFTPFGVEKLCELSWWAQSWLTMDGLPAIAASDTLEQPKSSFDEVVETIRRNTTSIDELGEFGPQFCAWCNNMTDEFTVLAAGAGGVFTAELGFIDDHDALYGRFAIRKEKVYPQTFLSAHAAASYWVSRVGDLLFPQWNDAVENQECFPGPYFPRLDDDPDRKQRNEQCVEVARIMRRVCWCGSGIDVLDARLSQERILFRHYADTTGDEIPPPADRFLGLSLDSQNKSLSRVGFDDPISFVGKPEQWPVIQRLVRSRDRGLTVEQLKLIDQKTPNAWGVLKNSINNTLAPIEIRVRPRSWLLEEIKS